MIELNPLDVLDIRQMDTIPPHFSKIKLSSSAYFEENDIVEWIKSNCSGRFSVSQLPYSDSDGKLKNFTFAGFEDEKELTYFMLACPNFRR